MLVLLDSFAPFLPILAYASATRTLTRLMPPSIDLLGSRWSHSSAGGMRWGFCSPSLLFIILNHIIGLFCLSQDLIREALFDFQQSQLHRNFELKGFSPTVLRTILVGGGVWLHGYNVRRFPHMSSSPSPQGGQKREQHLGLGPETGPRGHGPLPSHTTAPQGSGHLSQCGRCGLKRAAACRLSSIGFKERDGEGWRSFLFMKVPLPCGLRPWPLFRQRRGLGVQSQAHDRGGSVVVEHLNHALH